MSHKNRSRRGVVLLIVLSMLVLFVLLVTTFVVVSGQYQRAAVSQSRYRRTGEDPKKLLDIALGQLVRGVRGGHSSLAGHDLLSDLYGDDGVTGVVFNAEEQVNGQFVEIRFVPELNQPFGRQVSMLPDYYAGRVLTILDSMWHPGPDGAWGNQNVDDFILPSSVAAGSDDANELGWIGSDDQPIPGGGWARGPDNASGSPGRDSVSGNGRTDDLREAGWPLSDDRLTFGHRWSPGNDGAWGRAGVDDNGDGIVDNVYEAGWDSNDPSLSPQNSDDLTQSGPGHFWSPGNDGAWGSATVDEDGNGIFNDSNEAGWPGTDDVLVSAAAARSTRIVASGFIEDTTLPSTATKAQRYLRGMFWVRVEAFPSDVSRRLLPGVSTRLLINGAPFNGTGVGYNKWAAERTLPAIAGSIPGPLDGALVGLDGEYGVATVDDDGNGTTDDLPEAGWPGSDDVPVALLPHYRAQANTPISPTAGGSDESWDAVDFQNMYLAMVPPNITVTPEIIPSFHRPALVMYWFDYVRTNILLPAGEPENLHWAIFVQTYGPDNISGTGDEPGTSITPAQRLYIVNLKRSFIMRPLPEDNPNFTGSNTAFSYHGNSSFSVTYPSGFMLSPSPGSWDVDNDGDGAADSIWVDIGLPVQQMPDGRLFRPLVAILVKDMDGRLNLNAHNSLEYYANVVTTMPNYPQNHLTSAQLHPGPDGRYGVNEDFAINNELRNSTATGSLTRIPRGMGVGPAEISLDPVFEGPSVNPDKYQPNLLRLLWGRYDRTLSRTFFGAGRSDGNDDPFSAIKSSDVAGAYPWSPGADGRWGSANVDDDGDMIIDNATEAGWRGSDDVATATASPLDVHGMTALALDHTGHPIMTRFTGRWGDTVDDPYEKRVGPLGAGLDAAGIAPSQDNLFTLADLERLLRWNDIDVGELPATIPQLGGIFFNDTSSTTTEEATIANRNLFTTHSSHIPAPHVGIPPEFRQTRDPAGDVNYKLELTPPSARSDFKLNEKNGTSPTILDLYAAKIRATLAVTSSGLTVKEVDDIVNRELPKIVPFELRRGERFNINRPFGNGRDDNGNGVIDEPLEAFAGENTWTDGTVPSRYINSTFHYKNDNPIATSNARQDFARHLYCLMMLLVTTDTTDLGTGSVDTENFLPAMKEMGLSADDPIELTARRVAQWAVNVVDSRDPDAIMTAFEYDVNPFDGWSVDHVLHFALEPGPDGAWGDAGVDDDGNMVVDDISEAGTAGTDDYLSDHTANPTSQRRIVWGCEYPDLLLTESVAFHNRRVRDTDMDNGGNSDDPNGAIPQKKRTETLPTDRDSDLDQYRLPQGSLFLELYCTRNYQGYNAVMPREIYGFTMGADGAWGHAGVDDDRNGTTDDISEAGALGSDDVAGLDLGRLAPARTPSGGGASVRHPVWRVAFAEHETTAGGAVLPTRTRAFAPGATQQVDSLTFEPASLQPGVDDAADLTIERFAWFAPLDPGTRTDITPSTIFWGRTGASYAATSSTAPQMSNVLLAPNRYAVVGPRTQTYIGSAVDGPDMDPLTLDNSAQLLDLSGANVTTTENATDPYPASSGMMQTIQQPLGLICAANPPSDWANPTRQIGLNISEPLPVAGSYYAEPTKTLDRYADLTLPYDPVNNFLPDEPFDTDDDFGGDSDTPHPTWPLIKYPTLTAETGTRLDFRTAFVQRLADPLLPWNPMPGEPQHSTALPINPYITLDWSSLDLTVFSGDENTNRQPAVLGGMEWIDELSDPDPYGSAPDELFGSRERSDIDRADPATDSEQTLWSPYSADPAATGGSALDAYFSHRLAHSLGYLNERYYGPKDPSTPTPDSNYLGSPEQPFPWLTFNNRPFANPGELMLVPASSPGRLLYEFSSFDLPSAYSDPSTSTDFYTGTTADDLRSPFGHLLNFFSTAVDQDAPHHYRLFDYIETPSPYVGTEIWYDPQLTSLVHAGRDGAWGVAGSDDNMAGGTDELAEAGFGDDATDSLGHASKFRPPFNRLSRFQDPGRININTIFDTNVYDALFENFPDMQTSGFYSALTLSRQGFGTSALDFYQVVGGVPHFYPSRFANPFRASSAGDLMPSVEDIRKPGVQATLHRSVLGGTTPLFDSTPTASHRDSDRNAYFRYQGLSRLENMLTTNSNVFGAWVTVGFFEVEPVPATVAAMTAHPDGYRLGPEVGWDTGEIKRHRGFYMIDRSIPVAFEPGEDHNTEQAILIRRFIE